jgi:glycerol-3-phosphate dehydrogenase
MEAEGYDLIVIGGGINGAAIAREAAVAGNSVLLLERDDFGCGTSATSTRLIHGGLRYLEHAEFSLVHESLSERERLLRTAPHLVEPLEIVLPLTRDARRGRFTIKAGMLLYDLLSVGKSVPAHRMLGRDRIRAEMPGIADDVVAAAAYYDAQVAFAERLVLENVLDAHAAGATIRNHTAATEIRVESGQVRGVGWTDSAGRHGFCAAPVVVNAGGPWVDRVLGGLVSRKLIGGTRGSHLIVRRFETAPGRAVYAEAGSDGRPFFIIPWNGLYLIGTTDERYDGDPSDAQISGDEARYLIDETRRLFPRARDLEASVLYTYSGIRPLPSTDGVNPGAITRRHLIESHGQARGLYSIVGGKLTTHRALAADCLKRLRPGLPKYDRQATVRRRLPGALDDAERDALLEECSRALGDVIGERLWRTYGARTRKILARIDEARELGQTIGADSGYLVAEVVVAIEDEWAQSLDDILLRRTMAGLEADGGRRSAPLVADWLVRLGYWNKTRAAEELAAYRATRRRFRVPSTISTAT